MDHLKNILEILAKNRQSDEKGVDRLGAQVKIIKIIIAAATISYLRRTPIPGFDSFGKPFFTIIFKIH